MPYRVKLKDGSIRWISDYTTIERNDEGKVIQYYGYIFDITSLKEAEAELMNHKKNLEELVLYRTKELEETNIELIEAKNKAIESDNLKSAFLANMSHEIRTPMNHILGFGELLKDEISEEERQQYIEHINQSGNHLLALINDIIDISKLEADQVCLNKSVFSINNEMKTLYNQFSSNEKCKNGKVNLILDDSIHTNNDVIISDKVILNQVMINLLNNALKFTEKGFVKFGYRTVKTNGEELLEFYVEDTGTGIPEDDKEIIFDRFRQSNNALKNPLRGTGLGLSICKANIGLLGGELNLKSEIGLGSRFGFIIPANSDDVKLPNKKILFKC